MDHLDFKIGVEPKEAPPFTIILVASSRQEKAAWTSDISQVSPCPIPQSLGPSKPQPSTPEPSSLNPSTPGPSTPDPSTPEPSTPGTSTTGPLHP